MPPEIHPFRRNDRQAVRDICAATCWMGEHRTEAIPDDWIWAEYWTRYFTDVEPQHSWVVRDEGRVVGYLTGTADAARAEAYTLRLGPGIVWHVVRRRLMRRPQSRRAIASLLGSLLHDRISLPPPLLRHFPATMHMNLLPPVRRGGIGMKLLGLFVERMRRLGVSGIHAQPLDINVAPRRALARAGFHPVGSTPTRAFGHVHPEPVNVETWVLDLQPAACPAAATAGEAT